VARTARFAYELGAGQARWAGRVPGSAWLSRRWLAQYLAEGPPLSVEVQDAFWNHPAVAAWPAPVRRELRRLWVQRGRLLAAAEATERTLCHLDVWPANLIDSQGRSVLLDWSSVGEGAVGEDVSNLILDSFADGLMDAELLPEVAETTTDRYLQGLRDGGWSGSPDRVRTAIAACGAAKYSWLGPAILGRAVRDDLGTSSYNRDGSAESVVRRVAGLLALIADWAQAAAT
jgi:Phosphotransferase enzyme family